MEENQQNRFSYAKLAIVSDRYQVSSRDTAAIVNAALEDMGLLNDSNKLDRKKVLREKLRVGIQNANYNKLESSALICMGFDGRTAAGTIKEEHYSIIKEPGSINVDHVTPDCGSSKAVSDEIINCIVDTNSEDSNGCGL